MGWHTGDLGPDGITVVQKVKDTQKDPIQISTDNLTLCSVSLASTNSLCGLSGIRQAINAHVHPTSTPGRRFQVVPLCDIRLSLLCSFFHASQYDGNYQDL